MLKTLRHLKPKEWLFVIFCVIFVVAQVWLDLRIPDYMSDITTLVTTPGSEMSDIAVCGGWMLTCALGSLICAVVTGYIAARLSALLSLRLRGELFRTVESFSLEELGAFSTASLITRSTNDVTQLQMFIAMGLQVATKAPIMAVMAVGKMFENGSVEWVLLVTGALVFLFAVIIFVMLYALPKFRRIQWLTDNLNRVTRENLTGLMVVRAYNAEGYQEEKFGVANDELTDNNLKAQRVMSALMPAMSLVMNGISLGIYWIGAYLIEGAAMTEKLGVFSNMVVFSSYAMQVIMSFTMLTMILIMLPRASVAAKRINAVLDTKPSLAEGVCTDGVSGVRGEVEFKNVSFAYPGSSDCVIRDISFKAGRGETVAIIGATGSGKSTIVNLAVRFYDVTGGEVLVDGVNVKNYKKEALCDKFGYVPQRSVLFSGTVSSNVAFGGREISGETVRRAVSIAQGSKFVDGLAEGYEGAVAQGGANFSGGQKQRLSIARAVAREPEIYIFDDSFSALDYRTDRELRSALRHETAGVTSIIVAQRIGTIRDADRIIVLDDGEIAGIGTHGELMKSCEVYQEIAYSQLSKEELE